MAIPGFVIFSFILKSNLGLPRASLIRSSSTVTFAKVLVSVVIA